MLSSNSGTSSSRFSLISYNKSARSEVRSGAFSNEGILAIPICALVTPICCFKSVSYCLTRALVWPSPGWSSSKSSWLSLASLSGLGVSRFWLSLFCGSSGDLVSFSVFFTLSIAYVARFLKGLSNNSRTRTRWIPWIRTFVRWSTSRCQLGWQLDCDDSWEIG